MEDLCHFGQVKELVDVLGSGDGDKDTEELLGLLEVETKMARATHERGVYQQKVA